MNPRLDPPARIGVDLTSSAADGAWSALVREVVELAPDLSLHVIVTPAQRATLEPAWRGLPVQWIERAGGVANALGGLALRRRWGLDLLHRQGAALPWFGAQACAVSLHRLPQGLALRRLMQARLVCVPSRWAQDELVRRHGFDPARVVVVPPAVDGVRFRPGGDGRSLAQALGLDAGEYLCCVARCDAHKLPLSLLEAYALMPRPRPRLVLVSREQDPLHRLALEAAVQRLGLAPDVRLLDHITDTQLPALLRHARLFVQPARQAQRGMALLEAMASGVAVVTAELPVLAERAGAAALTVNPRDTHELAAAMLCLLADPRRRQALVRRGLARAEAHHARCAAERLVEGWREAVRRRATPSATPAWA